MTVCAAPRHLEPEPAVPSAFLCRPCTSQLRGDLYRLPDLYASLGDILSPFTVGPGTGSGDGLPYNEPASDCMSQIAHDLAWWVLGSAAVRGWEPLTDTRVPALAGWLHAQVRWVCVRDWAPVMAGAFAADRGRARALLNPRPVARVPIPPARNHCPRCGADGALSAVVYQDPGDSRWSLVTCAGCGYEWDATQWLRLGRDIIRSTEGQAA